MKISNFRRPGKDLIKIPKELEPLVSSYNSKLEEINAGLQNSLSTRDNLNCETVEFEAGQDGSATLKHKVRGKPMRVTVDWTSHPSYPLHFWEIIDLTTIQVTVAWDNPPTGKKTVRITIWGD